jgi:TIR domain
VLHSAFISHSWSDKQIARKIAQILKEHGVLVWIDEAEMAIGDSLAEKSKYPPAEPGALLMGPLEAAVGVADVIRHEVTLFAPAFLLQRQLAKHLPEVLLQFSVEHLPAGLGNEHHMVFALPPGGVYSRNRPS